jgi:hypothetical protein|tara:strand:- start:2737 stop:5229 length:2493 start_codon:yes stop_codon:yes gene_type:complete
MLTISKNNLLITILLLFVISLYPIKSQAAAGDIVSPSDFTGQLLIDSNDQLKRFEHNALDNLKMIDFFLCVMKVRADLFPNSNYKAQVNEAACNRLAGDTDENAPKVKMADITLSCSRASNTAPQICNSWYSISGENVMYLVKVQLDAEPTTAKPNGLFTFSWCMADASDGTCKASNLNYGQLSLSEDASGNTVVQLYDEYGGSLYQNLGCGSSYTCKDDAGNTLSAPVSVTDTINITLANHKMDSATGTSYQVTESFAAAPAPGTFTLGINSPATYNLSFDASHGLIKDPSTGDSCYPLDSPKEYVHQYDLYNRSTGALLPVGGGIPVTVKSVAAGSTAAANDRGWWDYWGLHVDGLASSGVAFTPKKITSGSVVTAQADSTAVGISKDDELTVNTAMGVLRSETSYEAVIPAVDRAAATTTMYQYHSQGKVFLWFDFSNASAVKVKTAQAGSVIAGVNSGNPVAANTDVTDAVDWCSGNSSIEDYCFGAHSSAVGGWFNVSDISAAEFKAYISERVTPGMTGFTSDVYLKCYGSNCPKPMDGGALDTDGYGATDFKNANNDSTYRYSFIDPNGGTPKYYMFDVSDMTLKHCETWNSGSSSCTGDLYPVICATDEGTDQCDTTDWSSSNHLYVDMVKHDVSISDWNDINSATRYIWNTSNNIYGDRLTWPSKSGTTISFSPPVNFAYDHTTTNDRNGISTYNGKKFGLEYGGNGNLWGIDWALEDPTCTMNCDYLPQISIKDGVVVEVNSTDHVILARRMDLRPDALGSTATCTDKGLDVSTSASAPSTPAIETIIDFGKNDENSLSLISTEVCVVDNVLTGAAGCPTE